MPSSCDVRPSRAGRRVPLLPLGPGFRCPGRDVVARRMPDKIAFARWASFADRRTEIMHSSDPMAACISGRRLLAGDTDLARGRAPRTGGPYRRPFYSLCPLRAAMFRAARPRRPRCWVGWLRTSSCDRRASERVRPRLRRFRSRSPRTAAASQLSIKLRDERSACDHASRSATGDAAAAARPLGDLLMKT